MPLPSPPAPAALHGDYACYQIRGMGQNLDFMAYINGQVVVNTNEPRLDAQ